VFQSGISTILKEHLQVGLEGQRRLINELQTESIEHSSSFGADGRSVVQSIMLLSLKAKLIIVLKKSPPT
jgi:hypothetical protein